MCFNLGGPGDEGGDDMLQKCCSLSCNMRAVLSLEAKEQA